MKRFFHLTLRNVPWFTAAFIALAAIGYFSGDLPKLSPAQLLSLIITGPATIVAVSAVGAGQALLRQRRKRSKSSN